MMVVVEVGGSGRAVGGMVVVGGAIDGAWRIIMTRLTLARAVCRASRVTSRSLDSPSPPD